MKKQIKYLCVMPDGICIEINKITKEIKEMVDNGDYLIFRFKGNNYYQYLGDDGWEKIETQKSTQADSAESVS